MMSIILGLVLLCVRIMYSQSHQSVEIFEPNLQFLNKQPAILIDKQLNSMHLEYCFPNNTWIGILTADQLISTSQIECGKYVPENCDTECIEECLKQQTSDFWNRLSRLHSI